MATKKLKSIKGRVARLTRLDECGAPVFGDCSTVATYGFITVTLSAEEEAGDEYTQKNAWGEFCINEKDPDLTKWTNVSIQFCEVDPDVLDIVSGANPVIVGSDTIGATFGPNPSAGAFAIEVWTKKTGTDACASGGDPEWGYFIVPFVKNGKVDGDVTIEAAPLNITLTGEGHGAPAAWGVGPYGDNPLLATAGFPTGDFWGMVVTTVQPPSPTDGCQPLVEPPAIGAVEVGDLFSDPAITAESAPEAATLAGLGYIVAPPGTAWASGEFFTINTFKFNWSGAAWAAGAHA